MVSLWCAATVATASTSKRQCLPSLVPSSLLLPSPPRLFHTVPNVPHYSKNKAVGVMKPGHTFTIEPMINEGRSALNSFKPLSFSNKGSSEKMTQ